MERRLELSDGYILFTSEEIYIFIEGEETEVVMWHRDEWEDPSAATATLNAIQIAVIHGVRAVKSIIDRRAKFSNYIK